MAMTLEKDFQAKCISELREMGYKCFKQQMNATTRAGTPDCFVFKDGFWAWIEFKKHRNSPKRPGQQRNVDWANENSYGTFLYPENYDEVMAYFREIAK